VFKQAMSATWIAAMTVICIGAGVILLFVYRDVEYSYQLWWQFELDADAPRGLRAILGLAIASSLIAIYSLLRSMAPATASVARGSLDQAIAITKRQNMADANLVRLGDKKLLFSDYGDAFIMYGTYRRTWIALFDPVGEQKSFQELVWRFVEAAREAGCRPVFYQISPGLLSYCADAGLRAFKLGELATVNLRGFDLKGRKGANLRQTASRAARDGLTFSVIAAEDVHTIIGELKVISDAWLADHNTREKGFSLGVFDKDYICAQPVAVLRMDGAPVAFATIMVTETRMEATVDLMRFMPSAPKGSMDFLFVNILQYLRHAGYASFNLGMAPLSGMSRRSAAPFWDKVGGAMFEHGARFYNFKGLRAFKSKFHPDWEPRYLAVAGSISPLIALIDLTLLISGGMKGVVGK
jgi:phosphatidylglycerol lysyltransferase